MDHKLRIVLASPGEAEASLLAELRNRGDLEIISVVDPSGQALGAALAEIMGIPVRPDLDGFAAGPGTLLVLPSVIDARLNDLAAAAEGRGIEVVRSRDVAARLGSTKREVPIVTARTPLATVVERETAAIEAALERFHGTGRPDSLQAWVLDLGLRAVQASGGSLLLVDETTGELTIACALGLSEGIVSGTCLAPGAGHAGRVAISGRADLIVGGQTHERPGLTSAICAPLAHAGRVVGVLNVSRSQGEPPLGQGDVAVLETLAGRFAAVVAHAERLQSGLARQALADCGARLRHLSGERQSAADLLGAWAPELARALRVSMAALTLVRDDGGYLRADSDGHVTALDDDPGCREALAAGIPLVSRDELTIPIAADPVLGALSLRPAGAGQASALRSQAVELAAMLADLLSEHIGRRSQIVLQQRLTRLGGFLGDLAAADCTVGRRAELVCEAAMELTGARQTAAVAEITAAGVRLAGGNAPADAVWLTALPPLLEAASADGWRITTLAATGVLVATCRPGRACPALVLVGKDPIHPLDGTTFTPHDARIAAALAAVLYRLPEPATVPEAPLPANGDAELLRTLRREIARCERYHNVFGLILLQVPVPHLAARVAARLRASDRVFELATGELAVLVPEDVQGLEHCERRLRDELRTLTAGHTAQPRSVRVTYPASRGTPQELLARARRLLA